MASALLKIEKWFFDVEINWNGKGKVVVVNSGPFCVCCFSWTSEMPPVQGAAWCLKGHPSSRPRFPCLCVDRSSCSHSSWHVKILAALEESWEEPSISLHLFSYRLSRTEGLGTGIVFNVKLSALSQVGSHTAILGKESLFKKFLLKHGWLTVLC